MVNTNKRVSQKVGALKFSHHLAWLTLACIGGDFFGGRDFLRDHQIKRHAYLLIFLEYCILAYVHDRDVNLNLKHSISYLIMACPK